MPSASPTARPSNAPSARSTRGAAIPEGGPTTARGSASGARVPATAAPRAVVVEVEVRGVQPAGHELDHLTVHVASDGEQLQPRVSDRSSQSLRLAGSQEGQPCPLLEGVDDQAA